MRILVCGGRDYIDERKVFAVLHEYKDRVTVIIHGNARGADLLASQWALVNRIHEEAYPITKADWERFGRGAGPRRNKQMLVEGNPDLVIAFKGGNGTENMITQSIKANVTVIRIPEE